MEGSFCVDPRPKTGRLQAGSKKRKDSCNPSPQNTYTIKSIIPEVLVLPVSGHGMVEQIGILLWLSSRGYSPKVSLGASGGAIASALGTAWQWDFKGWITWMQNIHNVEVFKERPLGWVEAFFRASLYEIGPGLDILFHWISAPQNEEYFRNQELLVSAQNSTQGHMEIFSTVSRNKSVLKDAKGPLRLFGASCYVIFLGEITSSEIYRKKLIKVLKATSAVPVVFPAVNIDGDLYVDGGVSFASPLNPVMSIYKTNEILYIFPEDIEQPNPQNPKTTIESGLAFLSQSSRSKYYDDRNSYLQGICAGDFNSLMRLSGDASSLERDLELTQGKTRMVELFPCFHRENMSILSKHNKAEMMQRIQQNMTSFKYRIFYV